MFRFLVPLILAGTPAIAAPTPFVVYHSPAARCDVLPVSAACRAAEREDWSDFLAGRSERYFPRVTKVRLADLFDGKTVHYGWTFRIIAPAPARWRKLALTVGGIPVAIGPYDRYERQNTLVAEATIDRAQLSPGTHRVEAKDGATVVFAFDLELEGSSAPPPLDPKQLAAELAAATAKPPLIVGDLPAKPACTASPSPAGCNQSVARMWIDLFTAKHDAKLSRRSRTDAGGAPIPYWQAYLVFPTAPTGGWIGDELSIEIDRKPAKYAHDRHRRVDSDAIIVGVTLLESDHAAGAHEIRALDRNRTVLFSQTIELVK